MSKNTPEAGARPNASIDFNKAHENAKAGKENIYADAVATTKPSDDELKAEKTDKDLADASRLARARDAGFDTAEAFEASLAGARTGDSTDAVVLPDAADKK